MLGSAFVVLDIEDHDAGATCRLVFSGDLGRNGIPIIRDPETIDQRRLPDHGKHLRRPPAPAV